MRLNASLFSTLGSKTKGVISAGVISRVAAGNAANVVLPAGAETFRNGCFDSGSADGTLPIAHRRADSRRKCHR
jgi:hypothetical protein